MRTTWASSSESETLLLAAPPSESESFCFFVAGSTLDVGEKSGAPQADEDEEDELDDDPEPDSELNDLFAQ